MSEGDILYIEDSPQNRRIVRKILEREAYILHEAEDGLEGYNRLKQLMPKVVMLDISLPTMDGMEIASKVKADDATKDVILIALTASTMAGDRERILRAGCDDYLSKPFRALDLLQKINFYMSPDFVPGRSLSPGEKLRQSEDAARKQAQEPAPASPPEPPRQAISPAREAPQPAEPENTGSVPQVPPASPESQPEASEKPDAPAAPKEVQPRAKKTFRKSKSKTFLSDEIGDMLDADSIIPADPNTDEDEEAQ